jgi:hypothetical protein
VALVIPIRSSRESDEPNPSCFIDQLSPNNLFHSPCLPARRTAYVYGCHYDKERKDYHCHEGAFKGGSFDSKIEMIRRLRLQFLNLGRPWPYEEIAEEDITSL